MKQIYTVYCIKNKIDGRRYIGITSRTLEKRWMEHVKSSLQPKSKHPLHVAMKRDGVSSFEFHDAFASTDMSTAAAMERRLIFNLGTRNRKRGYNSNFGGNVGKNSGEKRKRDIWFEYVLDGNYNAMTGNREINPINFDRTPQCKIYVKSDSWEELFL